jgi:hypothetical protein
MPRTYSSIDKICAELAWVNETPDPDKCGCRNLRCCEELDAGLELALLLSPRSSGHSGESTTVHPVANMDGAELRLVDP